MAFFFIVGNPMLQKVFLWFYCLSIKDASILIILVSVAYLFLRYRLNQNRLWRSVIVIFFLAWLIVIAFATIMDRTPDAGLMSPQLLPLHSYRAVLAGENREILRSNFMNVVLFYPVGLLACELLPKKWSRAKRIILVTALFVLLSSGIEACQYCFALGQVEADDVLHNGLGALIGAAVCTIQIGYVPRH